MKEEFDLLRDQGDVESSEYIFDNTSPSILPTREVRITLEPISSIIISFDFERSNNGRNLELINNSFLCKKNQNIEMFSCNRGNSPYYYRGRTVTEIRPLGAIEGTYKQQVEIEALEKGDLFGCRLLHEDVPGATIKVEVFDNQWKVVVFEEITRSFIQHKINW